MAKCSSHPSEPIKFAMQHQFIDDTPFSNVNYVPFQKDKIHFIVLILTNYSLLIFDFC